LFGNVRLADNAGYGFDKMLKWEKETKTKVVFENSIDVALVTFKLEELSKGSLPKVVEIVTERSTENSTENSTETTQKTTQKTTEKTTEKILQLLKENPGISQEKVAEVIGITSDGVFWHIKKLKAKGLLKRIGPDKGSYWSVKS
jgi:ATP-dependent DNA helicase RecG